MIGLKSASILGKRKNIELSSAKVLFTSKEVDASLIVHNLTSQQKELVDKCVIDVADKLISKPPLKIFGKLCHQQRDVGFFARPDVEYIYSGYNNPTQGLSDNLSALLDLVNEKFTGGKFNAILVNRYEGGENYMGFHSDDEKGLSFDHGVLALSIGVGRSFVVKDKKNNKSIFRMLTESHTLLQMAGKDFQVRFKHGIPVEKKIKGTRYSFTFRAHA